MVVVTRKSYFISFKPVFGSKFWALFQCEVKNIIMPGYIIPCKVGLNQRAENLEKLKIPVWMEPLVDIFDQVSCC